MKRTIAIVCGGDSSEHDVSLRSAQGLYSFFDKERYDVYIVDIKGQDWHVELHDGTTTKIDRNDFSFVEDEGRIEGNIGRDPKDRLRMEVFPPDSETGKPAVTHYKVMERYGYTTLVECVLETGRTHQIRAHMKHIGHPLFCDERYGGTEILRGERTASYKAYIQNCFKLCPRQVLHARTLGFVHPTTGRQMDFTSEWPDDMAALIDKWRKYIKYDNKDNQDN